MKEKPSKTDPQWSGFVMEHFLEDELFKGYPKTDGLRRVAELLLGKIVCSKSKIIQCPNATGKNLGVTVVQHRLDILTEDGIITVVDVADVWEGNTEKMFARFPAAVAATRAEGRTLRKALHLKTIAAEELPGEISSFDIDNKGNIEESQINFINILCSRNDINVLKFINSGSKKYAKIEDVSYEVAVKMINHLGELQNNADLVVDSIKGYNSKWRNN